MDRHTPPAFGASRRSRAAPLDRASPWGPRNGPPTPPTFGASRRSRAAPLDRASPWGPEMAPQFYGGPRDGPPPPAFGAPGGAVALLYLAWGARDGPKTPMFGAPGRSRGAPLSRGLSQTEGEANGAIDRGQLDR